ncbi:hypothetical protein ATI53_1001191 [Salipiger aestuarii]|uniref:Uncharacterized protein n=1 Tax=Salipiger aestuarii TaxID=568098 RepID=A0A327YSE0_9RHOB|nr:hypothetical protein [Salipiger aestuarii]RAK24084.1 hypothetical protein ATI53_1001191 [Salipiger aestuarii]
MLIPTKFAGLAKTLCTPDLTHRAPAAVQFAWLDAKAAHGQPITPERQRLLADRPSHYPGTASPIPEAPFVEVIVEGDPDPLPPAPALSEVDRIHVRAISKIRAAVVARLHGGDAA